MRPSASQDYPEYEDAEKQEAARFLCADFDSYAEIIRGITDPDRLDAWTDVAKELDKDEDNNIDCSEARHHLRKRRRALQAVDVDADDAFTAASEIDTDSAVADGGAVVEEASDENAEGDGRYELDDDQEWAEYDDEAAFESAKNDQRRTVWDLVTTVEEAEEALEKQLAKDVVPRHTVELLEERLEDLNQ